MYGTLLLCTVLLCGRKEEEVNEFVSAVCWKQNSNVIVAANSQGTIKVSKPKTIVMSTVMNEGPPELVSFIGGVHIGAKALHVLTLAISLAFPSGEEGG